MVLSLKDISKTEKGVGVWVLLKPGEQESSVTLCHRGYTHEALQTWLPKQELNKDHSSTHAKAEGRKLTRLQPYTDIKEFWELEKVSSSGGVHHMDLYNSKCSSLTT